MSVIELLTRVEAICNKYDRYDIDKQNDSNVSGVDADIGAALEVHGILNAVSWGFLFPVGVIIARYMRPFTSQDPAWFYLHVCCQISAYAIGVVGWATGMKMGRVHTLPTAASELVSSLLQLCSCPCIVLETCYGSQIQEVLEHLPPQRWIFLSESIGALKRAEAPGGGNRGEKSKRLELETSSSSQKEKRKSGEREEKSSIEFISNIIRQNLLYLEAINILEESFGPEDIRCILCYLHWKV